MSGRGWTTGEVRALEKRMASCSSWEEIAAGLPGRTVCACIACAVAHGLGGYGPGSGPFRRRWEPEEDAVLRDCWLSGGRVSDICRSLGRTRGSVKSRARTLGVPGRRALRLGEGGAS